MSSPTAASLMEEIERRFVTTTDQILLSGREIDLLRPRNSDDLISEADFVRDDRLPYWADLWPSAIVLADEIVHEDGVGRSLLEIGCGVGLVSIAAMRAGFEVLATDYYEDALLFTRANAWRVVGEAPSTRHVDWRALPDDLGRYDRVLAADVLYERAYGELVALVIDRALVGGGLATVADPGRVAADLFLSECDRRGLDVRSETRPFEAGTVRQTIRLHHVTRRLATTSEMS